MALREERAIEGTYGRRGGRGPQRGHRAIEGTEYCGGGQRVKEGT